MSFFGDFEARCRPHSAELGIALELTLNVAAWDGGTAVNLSSGFARARGRSYDGRIQAGGFQQITRSIDLRAAGLATHSATVTIPDPDRKLRTALETGDQRYSIAKIWRVIPDSDTDYSDLFTGVLMSWAFLHGQVELHLRTDDRQLRSYFPEWPYLKSEWFWMSPDFIDTLAGLAYGKHDSTALGLDHGMIPTVPIYVVPASISWHGVCLAPGNLIKDVYVDGVIQTHLTDYNKIYGSLAGGKIYTIIEFLTIPADDAIITCDLYGYAASNSSQLFDGSEVMTNPVEQMRHFFANFATLDRTDPVRRGYAPGAWYTTSPIVDATSWSLALARAAARGQEGSRFLQDPSTVLEIFREWLETMLRERAFWNAAGKIALAPIGVDWPGLWDQVTPLIRTEEEIGRSFECAEDDSDITGKITTNYLRDSVEDKFLRKLVVQDLSSDVLSDTTYDAYWAPARQV